MADRLEPDGVSDPPDHSEAIEPNEPRPGDFYAALGAQPSATLAELKQAYHREAKRWHPDRYASASPDAYERAERRMRLLTVAYHTLSDPQARAEYDAGLRPTHVSASGPGGVSSSIVGGYPGGVERHRRGAEHATANPNGAGQFFAALAAVIGLALLANLIQGGSGSNVGVMVFLLALLIALAVVAGLFLVDSSASRWATRVVEGEPRGYAPFHRTPRAAPRAHTSSAAKPEDDESRFKRLVREALASIPAEFEPYMENIVIEVEDEPSEETLRQAGVATGYTLLGLYQGVPLRKRGMAETLPDVITIYRGPIERTCGGDPDRIREQVRATALHELAHHFGIDHDEMPEWVK